MSRIVYIKCPHCKKVETISNPRYDYTIGSPLGRCKFCGEITLNSRKEGMDYVQSISKGLAFSYGDFFIPVYYTNSVAMCIFS